MATLTEFGKLIRKLRIERSETMADMSAKIGKSPSFLSAIETGRKSIPAQVVAEIGAVYHLSPKEAAALRASASLSANAFRLEPSNDQDRLLVAAFAAKYDSLSADERNQLWQVLKD